MHNIESMYVLDAIDELVVELTGFLLAQPFAPHDEVEQFATLNEFHHEEEVAGSLDDLVQLDYVGMAD